MSDDPRESPDAVPDPPADAPAPAAGGAAPGDGEEPGTSDVREPATPDGEDVAAAGPGWRGGRRDRKAAATIGVLTLLLGFAFAVQVRNTGTDEALVSAREQDLVVLLDNQTAAEDRLRQEIADQQAVLDQLGNTDNQAAAALEDARERAEALDVLNGSIAATGPGLELTIRDPEGRVEPATVLNAVQELRGAGAETMQVDDVRVSRRSGGERIQARRAVATRPRGPPRTARCSQCHRAGAPWRSPLPGCSSPSPGPAVTR